MVTVGHRSGLVVRGGHRCGLVVTVGHRSGLGCSLLQNWSGQPCYNKLPARGGVGVASFPVTGCLSINPVLSGLQGGHKVIADRWLRAKETGTKWRQGC